MKDTFSPNSYIQMPHFVNKNYPKSKHDLRVNLISVFSLLLSLISGLINGTTCVHAATFAQTQQAAEKGDADSQYDLGFRYFMGAGTKQDYSQAVQWYTKAAHKGHAEAQNSLAFMYRYGKGVKKDEQKMISWTMKAAGQGHIIAQCELGYMYYHGEHVRRNLQKAARWFTQAAMQGFGEAQLNLAGMYFNGEGVPYNTILAYAWWTLAAEEGYSNARMDLKALVSQLGPQELKQAKATTVDLRKVINRFKSEKKKQGKSIK